VITACLMSRLDGKIVRDNISIGLDKVAHGYVRLISEWSCGARISNSVFGWSGFKGLHVCILSCESQHNTIATVHHYTIPRT